MGKRKQVVEFGPAEIDIDKIRSAAAEFSKAIGDQAKVVGARANELAGPSLDEAMKWAGPKVESAQKWAGPKVKDARKSVVKAAAPRLEAAAASSVGLVDVASHKLTDEILPRIEKMMHDAAASVQEVEVPKGRRAAKKARKVARSAEKQFKKDLEKAAGSSGGGRVVGWMIVGTAAAGAGYLLWRRAQPVEDPWAEEYWQNVDGPADAADKIVDDVTDAASDVADTAEDMVEDAGEKAKDAVDSAADAADDAVEDAKN